LRCEPLSPAAFAPFGAVLAPGDAASPANDGRALRHPQGGVPRGPRLPPDAALETALYRIRASTLPLVVDAVERHPHSGQLFHPATGGACLVCVCPAAADGRPDPSGARAFLARSPQGIVYAPGVWHLPLVAVDADGEFLMVMWSGSAGEDCVINRLDEPLLVEA
jgi:ureidoglycolate lyase